jgi:arylsulfatase A-like enzyme
MTSLPSASPTTRPGPPNVIWVFGDQHRACATGFAGDPNLHTPHLDRLAAEGTVFRHAVAGTPLCSPFRGSLLTGRYPHHCVPGHEDPLPDGMPTVADAFNTAGYDTAWFGKWHIDGFKEQTGRAAFHTVPRDRRGGFKSWLGYENNLIAFDCWLHGHDNAGNEVEHFPLEGYETDALTSLLIAYLEERGVARGPAKASETLPENPAPFFAALSVTPPHNPFIAPAEWMERHTPGRIELRPNVPPDERIRQAARQQLAGYYAMIENLDHNLGRLRAALQRTGLHENTLIIFFSDHGDMMGSHGHMRKTSIYEESLNIPFVIGGGIPFYASTGRVKPQVLDHPLNHVDIASTTLGLCGIRPPAEMEGFDYSAHVGWSDAPVPPAPASAFLQYCQPSRYGHCIDRPWRGVKTAEGWKYACFEHQPWVLFDVATDPYEFHNQAFHRRSRSQRQFLSDMLEDWITKTGDRFALPTVHMED